MLDGFAVSNGVSFILVFLEGLLSFFSPCVIPLIPVYMGYLAGSAKKVKEDGTIAYDRSKVFFHTLFFAFGVSFAFFLLGISFTALGSFFNRNQLLFTRIGGILIILLGTVQLGIFQISFFQKERKIHLNLAGKEMNPIMALLMGFTFSFAWTPCIGPMLSSVLIMASGAKSSLTGNILVFVYGIGFLIPFLLLGLFTTQILNFLKSKQKLLKYTIKAGGVILILMGIMTFTGWMNSVSSYLNTFTNQKQNSSKESSEDIDLSDSNNNTENSSITTEDESELEEESNTEEENNIEEGNNIEQENNIEKENNTEEDSTKETEETKDSDTIPAFDFTLLDQYGNEHTLSDYKGKVVFLNFWASWCSPCKQEMPDIEELYQEYNLNQEDVIFLGVSNPSSKEYPQNQDGSKEELIEFLDENGFTFPVLFDQTGEVFENYYISAFPTTFMIDKDGNVVGYVPGMMTKDIMISIINQTKQATE